MVWGKAGSTTLASAGDDLDITSMTASKFNQILYHTIASGATDGRITYNNNTNGVYCRRGSNNGGTDFVASGTAYAESTHTTATDKFSVSYLCSSGAEKLQILHYVDQGSVGVYVPNRLEFVFKFVPSPDADITIIDMNNTQSGSFDTSSNISALGSDLTPSAGKPTDVQEGSRWEETDTRKMYHYTYDWFLEGTTIPPQPSTRGLFAGGEVSSNVIDYITIATAGNATDFGDLTLDGWNSSAVSSGTRAVFMGGTSSSGFSNVIQYVTVATTGNATDFGDLITAMNSSAGVSSETRGIMGGGNNGSNVSNMEFITIATAGTGTDFGDLSQARHSPAGVSSGTRGVWGGGYAGGNVNTIDYVTIDANPTVTASTFGNLSQARRQLAGCGSTTRGLFGGGYASGHVNTIDYITIDTTPTCTDFGNLTRSNNVLGACSSNTRGIWGGGNNTNVNTIDYVTIDADPTVTATDFGDLTAGRAGVVGTDGY